MTFSDYAQEHPTIALKDDSGQPLLCQIEQTFDMSGLHYALLFPIDTPIEIFMWEEDESGETESLVDIEASQTDVLFPVARAVLAEHELMLQRTAITLTVAGKIPEPDDNDCFTLDIGDDEAPGEELTSEEFQILATFFHDDVEYTVCTPVDPLLFFARLTATGEAEVVPPEEFERLRPEIESTIFDVLE